MWESASPALTHKTENRAQKNNVIVFFLKSVKSRTLVPVLSVPVLYSDLGTCALLALHACYNNMLFLPAFLSVLYCAVQAGWAIKKSRLELSWRLIGYKWELQVFTSCRELFEARLFSRSTKKKKEALMELRCKNPWRKHFFDWYQLFFDFCMGAFPGLRLENYFPAMPRPDFHWFSLSEPSFCAGTGGSDCFVAVCGSIGSL